MEARNDDTFRSAEDLKKGKPVKDNASKGAWIGFAGVVLAAVVAGVFSLVQMHKETSPSPPAPLPQQNLQSAAPQTDPTADFITILDGKFETQSTGQEFIGGRARVGYFGKGLIQTNLVTACLMSSSYACANINGFPIGIGVREYSYVIDINNRVDEQAIILCIGDQTPVFNYLSASVHDRTIYHEPVCARMLVKR
jgi:hypothetical protein